MSVSLLAGCSIETDNGQRGPVASLCSDLDLSSVAACGRCAEAPCSRSLLLPSERLHGQHAHAGPPPPLPPLEKITELPVRVPRRASCRRWSGTCSATASCQGHAARRRAQRRPRLSGSEGRQPRGRRVDPASWPRRGRADALDPAAHAPAGHRHQRSRDADVHVPAHHQAGGQGRAAHLGDSDRHRRHADPGRSVHHHLEGQESDLVRARFDLQDDGRAPRRVVPPGPDNPMGEYRIRMSKGCYSIHGTDTPWAIGRETTHGCIRLYPEDIGELYSLVKPSMQRRVGLRAGQGRRQPTAASTSRRTTTCTTASAAWRAKPSA